MSPVEFKKTPCRPVDFKGQGPPDNLVSIRRGDKVIVGLCKTGEIRDSVGIKWRR